MGAGGLPWSVANDSARLVPGAPLGDTPVDFSVSVNTAGHLGGNTTVAHLTLNAPDAGGSPCVGQVVLQMQGALLKQLYLPLAGR